MNLDQELKNIQNNVRASQNQEWGTLKLTDDKIADIDLDSQTDELAEVIVKVIEKLEINHE